MTSLSRLSLALAMAAFFGLACQARVRDAPVPVAGDGASCAGCHRDVVREHDESLHGRAHTDPEYQVALSREADKGFCLRCHDPRGRGEGVTCSDCHVVFHSRAQGETRMVACESCHEFDFPSRAAAMQLTGTEHRASAHRDEPCTACHMKRSPTGGHPAHAFPASRDRAMLASAVHVTSSRDAANAAVIRIEPALVGHAFPTGDLFRRIVVGAERTSASGERLDFDERAIGRVFTADRGMVSEVSDERPGSRMHPLGVDVRFGLARGAELPSTRVRFWIDYERVLVSRGDDAWVQSRERIIEGEVP